MANRLHSLVKRERLYRRSELPSVQAAALVEVGMSKSQTTDPDRIYSAGFILDFTMTAHMSDGTPVSMNYRRIGEKTYPVGPDGKIVGAESDGR